MSNSSNSLISQGENKANDILGTTWDFSSDPTYVSLQLTWWQSRSAVNGDMQVLLICASTIVLLAFSCIRPLFWNSLLLCIHAYIHTCIHACIHTYVHTCIHTYIHTYICTYIHTYIH